MRIAGVIPNLTSSKSVSKNKYTRIIFLLNGKLSPIQYEGYILGDCGLDNIRVWGPRVLFAFFSILSKNSYSLETNT